MQISRLSSQLLRSIASTYGNKPALTLYGKTTLTYDQLFKQAERIANIVQANRTAILLPFKSVEFVTALCSAWINESCFLPMNPDHPIELLKYYLEDFQPDVVITSGQHADSVKHLKIGKLVDINDPCRCVRSKDSCDGFLVLYTSGTTGRPKGVLHSQQSIASQISAMQDVWKWTSNDCIYQVLPLHHIHGLVNCVLTPLCTGAHCILHDEEHFDPEKVFNRLIGSQFPISLFMAVPTIYNKLLKYYKQRNFSEADKRKIRDQFCNRIRLMVSGSASLPDTVYNGVLEMTNIGLIEQYGSTEMGRCFSTRPEQPIDQRPPGVVGKPMPHVQVRLCEGGQEKMEHGSEQGELEMKGPGLFVRYLNKPEATKEAFTEDGFFKTGDVASIDPQTGNYRIAGRSSIDLIKSGGYKISALEVERALLNNPDVEECAVFGVRDSEWGERVAAVIHFRPGRQQSMDEIRNFCAKYIPRYSCPTLMRVSTKPFERNAVGKIDKKKMRTEFFEKAG